MQHKELREKIIDVLKYSDEAIQLNEIAKIFAYKSDSPQYFLLKELLNQLVDEKLIVKSSRRKYSVANNNKKVFIEGIVEIANGVFFVDTIDDEFKKIAIKRRYLNTALPGDKVSLRLISAKKKNKATAEVIEVLERSANKITGVLEADGDNLYLVPDNKDYYIDFIVSRSKGMGAKSGERVIAKFLSWNDPNKSPKVEIIEKMGMSGTPAVEFNSIVEEFELPGEFPQEVIEQALAIKRPKNQKSYKNRVDLRDKLIFTIDPIDAKDFDDALSLEYAENGNYILGIHIADVSSYVEENSPLDIEARFRGNSTYLVDRVIPMLPHELSSDICSLKPDEIRFAFSVIAELDQELQIVNYQIHESVIKSKRRYHYDEVLQIIETGEGDNAELLIKLSQLAQKLRSKRFEGGGIEFETSEVKFTLNEDKMPIASQLRKTTLSTSLVEECMLLANKIVAGHIKQLTVEQKEKNKSLANLNLLPYIYRIHEQPDQKQIGEVLEFISSLSEIKVKKKKFSSRDINVLLESFKGHPEENIVSSILIRSMPKAIYSHLNFGHYGLGFSDYTHFTSPIRRYADLVIHRLIKEYTSTIVDKKRLDYLHVFVKQASQTTSITERSSMEAERAGNKLALCYLTLNYIGDEFEGTITGITSFGMFVTIDNINSEGLVLLREMTDDYYIFEEKSFCLVGKRTKTKYSLGGRVKVKIIRVNIQKRNMDFKIVKE